MFLAGGEQHTELGLRQAGDFLLKMAQRGGRHGHRRGKGMRVAADAVQLFQQHLGHAGLVHALHHHINRCGGEDAVILGLQALGRHVDQLAGVAAQLDARRGIAVELAACLPHTVEPLGVELRFQTAGLRLGLNAHGLRVKRAIHKVGVKNRTKDNVRVGIGQVLPRQRVGVLDAADIGGEHAVGARAGKVHPEVCAVELRQTAGKGGHIRAGRVAALKHQRQHRGIRGRLPPGGKPQMQRYTAAVEFRSVQCGNADTGRELFPFQIIIPFKYQ